MQFPAMIAWLIGESAGGEAEGPPSALSALANTRAVEVLPVPRGPTNKKAWAMRPLSIALVNVRTM